MKRTWRRRRMLINPGLQLRLAFGSLLTTIATLVIFALLVHREAVMLASDPTLERDVLMAVWPTILFQKLFQALFLCLPIILGISILTTFRVAGPVYRFSLFLRALRDGEKPAPCRIRSGDELQDFCDLLNEATTAMRAEQAEQDAPADRPAVLQR